MKEAGVLPNMVMVFGQMNEPPGSRFRVGYGALTMAKYFRDDEHRDVLLLIDNIFRFIQARKEVSGLMGQMPSRLGYQPTMGTELSRLEKRIANTDTGSITSIQAVYVPADDLTDPAAVHPFSQLSDANPSPLGRNRCSVKVRIPETEDSCVHTGKVDALKPHPVSESGHWKLGASNACNPA